MVRIALTLLGVLVLPVLVSAQVVLPPDHIVHLNDGTVLPGRLVDQTDSLVVLDHETLGRIEIPRDAIDRLEVVSADARSGWKSDPSANSILFTPTPATLPGGTGYFRSIELLILNFGYAPTDNFNVAVGTVFPISSEFVGLMGGAKLRLLDRERFPVGLAVSANYTYLEDFADDALFSFSGIAGIGDSRRSLNASIGGVFRGKASETVIGLGGDLQVSARTKLVAEFGTVTGILFDEDDFDGIMNVGFRFFGDTMSFTLTGFRPVGSDGGGLFLFPLGVFSIKF